MNYRKAFLTGASSGIGRALALELAGRGCDMVLSARRLDALQQLKSEIDTKHPARRVLVRALDVTRETDVAAAVREAQTSLGGLDLVVANAGVASTGTAGRGRMDRERALVETNVIGVMATVDAAVPLLREQGRGRIVVISSVAAFRGLPGSASYSATKAAVATYANAVRAELHHSGVGVTVLYPGFIDTPLNRDLNSRPFLINVQDGARKIADWIARGVDEASVPRWPWALVGWWLRWMPKALLVRQVKPQRG